MVPPPWLWYSKKHLLVGVGWMLVVKCWKRKNNGAGNVKKNGAVECWKFEKQMETIRQNGAVE